MFIHGGGGSDVFPRLPRAVKIISFDFALLSCRLLLVAQASICVISVRHELELVAGTTRYVSSANLKIRCRCAFVCEQKRRIKVCESLDLESPETSYSDILQRLVRRYLFKLERQKDEGSLYTLLIS